MTYDVHKWFIGTLVEQLRFQESILNTKVKELEPELKMRCEAKIKLLQDRIAEEKLRQKEI